MKRIFYSKDAQFDLTEDEFLEAMKDFNQGKRVFISRLGVSLSPMYIWAGEKPNSTTRKLHDGEIAVLKNGEWIDPVSGATYDRSYYPELTKDIDISDEISAREQQKRMSGNATSFADIANKYKQLN
jgi:hypothetical protein